MKNTTTLYRRVGGKDYVDSRHHKACRPLPLVCEHCDGERSALTRADSLRGNVCPDCDSALDEMFEEGAP